MWLKIVQFAECDGFSALAGVIYRLFTKLSTASVDRCIGSDCEVAGGA